MMYKNADWNKIWTKDFVYGHLKYWELDIFENIYQLLINKEKAILNAECNRYIKLNKINFEGKIIIELS